MSKNNEQQPSVEARLLSLNLRLSTLEEKHENLSHRVDESEDEINTILDKVKYFPQSEL